MGGCRGRKLVAEQHGVARRDVEGSARSGVDELGSREPGEIETMPLNSGLAKSLSR